MQGATGSDPQVVRSEERNTKRTHRQPDAVMVITARCLVPAVIVRTGAKLFGALQGLDPRSMTATATIPRGDLRAFFAPRIERYAVDGIDVPTMRFLDDAVIALADAIVARTPHRADRAPAQVYRIALEYVLASVFAPPGAVEPFGEYLENSHTFRIAVKGLRAAGRLTTAEAFASNDIETITKLIALARDHWASVIGLLAGSPFLATLRTRVATPILFQSIRSWEALRAAGRGIERSAVIRELEAIVLATGNPFCTEDTVAEACARVMGNAMLCGHENPFGTDAETVLAMAAANPFIDAHRSDGPSRITFRNAPPIYVVSALAFAPGSCNGEIVDVGDGVLRMQLELMSGDPRDRSLPVPSPRTAIVGGKN